MSFEVFWAGLLTGLLAALVVCGIIHAIKMGKD